MLALVLPTKVTSLIYLDYTTVAMPAHVLPTDQITELCRLYGVLRLDLFGSVARGDHLTAKSDVDLLVEFLPHPELDYFSQYFSFKEALEQLLGRPIDLVTAASVRNPFFRSEVERTKQCLYAA